MRRNLKLLLSYDGSKFHGWQVQPGVATIQGTLSEALLRVTSEVILPQGSGRTDAGVHALGQVASFELSSAIPTENLVRALNHVLLPAIRVLEASEMPPSFHARKSARSKTYRYRIYRGDICPPLLAVQTHHYPYPLDERAMEAAAEIVVGTHDFTSFAAVDPEGPRPVKREKPNLVQEDDRKWHETDGDQAGGSPARSNVRVIFSSFWRRVDEEMIYTVRGNGFLHHMVRNLVGTFLLVGKGTISLTDFSRILEARSRSAAGATAPPGGLTLVEVEY